MKYLLLSLIVLIGIVSCQKEITDEVTVITDTTILPMDTGKLEVDIESVHWVANKEVKAQFIAADVNGTPALIVLTATSSNGRELNFGMLDSGVHVYSVFSGSTTLFQNRVEYSDSTSPAKGSFYSTDSLSSNSVKIGTISITSIDSVNKTVTGSFSFKVFRQSDTTTRNFTNGTFTKVPFTKTGSSIPVAGTDSFRVKINDTLFNAYTVTPANGVGAVAINASDSSGKKTVVLSLVDTIKPGTYSFDLLTRSAIYTLNTTAVYAVTPGTGLLQILENNAVSKRVRGNFSFVGKSFINPTDTARLTEGYFSVELP